MRRAILWLGSLGCLTLLLGILFTSRPGVGRSFDFLKDLGPNRISQGRVDGDLGYLYTFPSGSADLVSNALKARLPKDGWVLHSEHSGHLLFARNGMSENVSFWRSGPGIFSGDLEDPSTGECAVLVQRPAGWFEREFQAIRQRLHLG